jgi:hypothetical protein
MDTRNPLEGLVGEQLSAVVFVQDYVQLQFDGQTITAFTPVSVIRGSRMSTFPAAGSRDDLCSVIGTKVVSQSVVAGDALTLEFQGGVIIRVPLDEASRTGPEAMNFSGLDNQLIVW